MPSMQLWNYTFQATLHSLFVGLLSFVFCGGAFLRADGPADVEKLTEHTFSFVTSAIIPSPKSVHLVGSFNGWNKDAMPMENTGNGTFSIKVKLSHGVHFYKFVVDGEKWNNDPASDKELEEDDNFGGRNSAVFIGPDARMLLKPMPNHVETTLIIHNPEDIRDANFTGTMLRVRIRLQTNAIQSVKAHAGPAAAELSKIGSSLGIDEYVGVLDIGEKADLVSYYFELIDGSDTKVFTPSGVLAPKDAAAVANFSIKAASFYTPDWAKKAVWYQIFTERFRNGDTTNDPGDFWYERRTQWNSDWYLSLPGEVPGMENFFHGAGNVWQRRYGGDIKGVIEKLPYLRSLGVNAIYFNPMFEAESMHKYDTADYRHIDDNFGVRDEPLEPQFGAPNRKPGVTAQLLLGNRKLFEFDGTPVASDYRETDNPATWKWTKSDLLFLDLVQEAHKQGFKVIIDGVFNHIGRSHPFFQDVLKHGKNSKYADWFEIIDWGDEANWKELPDPLSIHGKQGGIQWKGWDAPNGHLPAFKKDANLGLAEGPRNHILSITTRWLAPNGEMMNGVDGWRLDVPQDIPAPFWVEWRKVVKRTNPDAYITGEIWTWAQDALNGDQFDAVMNYRFADAVQLFFVNREKSISPSKFNTLLQQLIYNYPLQVALVQQNLFGSHDTDRFASMFVNPDRPYDGVNRVQDNAQNVGYDERKPTDEERKRQLQAVAFQMTFVGAPMIYYGDEAGMWSADDPSNRMPMVWKDLEPYDNPECRFYDDVFSFYQRTIAIRNALPALEIGSFRTLLINDKTDVIAFVREHASEKVFVVLNRSSSRKTMELETGENGLYIDWMNPVQATVVPANAEKVDGRPMLKVVDDAKLLNSVDGKLSIPLDRYGVSVLSLKKNVTAR